MRLWRMEQHGWMKKKGEEEGMFKNWQEMSEMAKEEEAERIRSRLKVNQFGSYELDGVKELTSDDWQKVKAKIFEKYENDTISF